jgi:hypothetical protein
MNAFLVRDAFGLTPKHSLTATAQVAVSALRPSSSNRIRKQKPTYRDESLVNE